MKNLRNSSSALALLTCLVISAVGCSKAEDGFTVPENTALVVSLSATVRSDWVEPGATVLARLEDDVVLDGKTVVSAGEGVTLQVAELRPASDNQPAHLKLKLVSVEHASGRTEVATHAVDFVGELSPPADDTTSDFGHTGAADRNVGSPVGGTETMITHGTSIVLPAGQRIRFETSDSFQVPIS